MTRGEIDAAAMRDLVRALAGPITGRPSPVAVDPAVLHTLARLVPADIVVFNDLAPRRKSEWAGADSISDEVWGATDEDPTFFDAFWSAPCGYPDRSGDRESVTTISDFCSVREWRRSPMYDALSDLPFDREMLVALPSPPGHSRRIRFLRLSGADFDDTDRCLAILVRPHLIAHLHALDLAARGVAPLTVRQRQLMSLLARGLTNAQIARSLGISSQTVRTHLQQVYTRLGVTSRGEAVALVRPPGPAQPVLDGPHDRQATAAPAR